MLSLDFVLVNLHLTLFGQKIGSNQALRHRISEMFVAVETSRASTNQAAIDVATGHPGALASAVTCAAHTLAVFPSVANQCLLVFGGTGFTWEGDIHFYVRRAFANAGLLGTVRALRSELVDIG